LISSFVELGCPLAFLFGLTFGLQRVIPERVRLLVFGLTYGLQRMIPERARLLVSSFGERGCPQWGLAV
jgi:hypothetical protein